MRNFCACGCGEEIPIRSTSFGMEGLLINSTTFTAAFLIGVFHFILDDMLCDH